MKEEQIDELYDWVARAAAGQREAGCPDLATRFRMIGHALEDLRGERDQAQHEAEQSRAELQQREWLPIEQAPKDGTELILARWDWLIDLSDVEEGSDEWKRRLFDKEAPRTYQFCWAKNGFWSERYQNWNDGIEPSGLIPPTHFQYITAPED